MSDVTDTLNANQAMLWQEYLSAEAQGVRPQTLSALSKFIEALQADSQEQRDAFAETFCRRMADDGVALPLREPLFASIVGPYLVSAHAQKKPDSERHLAYFSLNFWSTPPSRRLIELSGPLSPMKLLAEAFRRDPDGSLTQDALTKEYAKHFDYAVHEVPSGVLYSGNGATVAECEKWQHDLAFF